VVHRFAQLGQPAELDAWVAHLVLCALAPPGVRLETHLIGRASQDEGRHACLGPVDRPLEHLEALVAIHRTGTACALPLFPRTSRKYATVRLRDPDDPDRARQARLDAYDAFTEERGVRPDGADPYVRQLFDGVDPLAEDYTPVGVPAGAGDCRFAALALEVFGPLLAHRSKRA
jgi:exodeoxyribonuclease V gamma subunit